MADKKASWRDDPSVRRHPDSYFGGGVGYSTYKGWAEGTSDFDSFSAGFLHSWGQTIRAGDAFSEWFALGLSISMTNAKTKNASIGAFTLLLDTTFYPLKGLGIRPSVGLGLGFLKGKEEKQFTGGGPGCFSFTLTYEIRITRLFVIAPVSQIYWIASRKFDGLFLFFGIEFIKWFEKKDRNKK